MYYIYQLTFENGQTYIGSTNNLERRLQQHKRDCYKESRRHFPIYQCMRQCPNFTHEVLVEENCTEIVARQLEQQCINIYQPTLNVKKAFMTEEEKKEYKKFQSKKSYHNCIEKRREYDKQRQKDPKRLECNKKSYEKNREKIALRRKEKYEQHKEQISLKNKQKTKCECGSIVRKSDLSTHKKRTKKHLEFIMAIK